jgi:hypothetical protein
MTRSMVQTLNPGTESEGPAPSTSATDTSYPHLFRIDSAREAVLLIVASLVFALVVIYPMFCDVVTSDPASADGWALDLT